MPESPATTEQLEQEIRELDASMRFVESGALKSRLLELRRVERLRATLK